MGVVPTLISPGVGTIHWHPDVGVFETHGAIRDKWVLMGWETSGSATPCPMSRTTGASPPNSHRGSTLRSSRRSRRSRNRKC
ncbi:MAG: hypothetical protein LC104_03435 [Bacteroidales bacterium]|nr:hypothetical protein [Bacteroidales bacterium]